MQSIPVDLSSNLAEVAGSIEKVGLTLLTIPAQAVDCIGRYLNQPFSILHRQPQRACPCLLESIEHVVTANLKLTKGIKGIVIKQDSHMKVRPTISAYLTRPNKSNQSVVRILFLFACFFPIMLNLSLKRSKKLTYNIIRANTLR